MSHVCLAITRPDLVVGTAICEGPSGAVGTRRQNQNGQQVRLKVSSHERFKHTFYPALSNQDSYANSISDCLAGDSFGNKISKERQSKKNMDRKINF